MDGVPVDDQVSGGGGLDTMDDMYIRDDVLPAVTVQASMIAFIGILAWSLCCKVRTYMCE